MLGPKINNRSVSYQPEHAARLVAELSSTEDDWTYKVVEIGNDAGYVKIAAYDEDGEFIDFMAL